MPAKNLILDHGALTLQIGGNWYLWDEKSKQSGWVSEEGIGIEQVGAGEDFDYLRDVLNSNRARFSGELLKELPQMNWFVGPVQGVRSCDFTVTTGETFGKVTVYICLVRLRWSNSNEHPHAEEICESWMGVPYGGFDSVEELAQAVAEALRLQKTAVATGAPSWIW